MEWGTVRGAEVVRTRTTCFYRAPAHCGVAGAPLGQRKLLLSQPRAGRIDRQTVSDWKARYGSVRKYGKDWISYAEGVSVGNFLALFLAGINLTGVEIGHTSW